MFIFEYFLRKLFLALIKVDFCSVLQLTQYFFVFFHQILEEEFAREEREQQLFYAGNISDYPISPVTSNKESEEEPGEMQMDGEKTPEDNLSSKSSSGST